MTRTIYLYEPGHVLDAKYELVCVLGAGGMGVVYEGLDISCGKRVAIKIIRDEVAANNARSSEQMDKEARLMVGLRERSELVVDVITSGVTNDRYRRRYYVMELLRGHTLRHHIEQTAKKKEQFTIKQVCGTASDFAMALAPAHEEGVFHLDIKPENAFVHRRPDRSSILKVLDFGLSGWMGDASDDKYRGTPRYSAPEQFLGHPPSPASDIYAIGLIMFEMATLRPPFEDPDRPLSRAALEHAHCEEPAPLVSKFRTDFPAGFDAVVAACLEKDPRKRPQGGLELAKRLRPFLRDPIPASSANLGNVTDAGTPAENTTGSTDDRRRPLIPHGGSAAQVVEAEIAPERGAETVPPAAEARPRGGDSEVFVSHVSAGALTELTPAPVIMVGSLANAPDDIADTAGRDSAIRAGAEAQDRTDPTPQPPFEVVAEATSARTASPLGHDGTEPTPVPALDLLSREAWALRPLSDELDPLDTVWAESPIVDHGERAGVAVAPLATQKANSRIEGLEGQAGVGGQSLDAAVVSSRVPRNRQSAGVGPRRGRRWLRSGLAAAVLAGGVAIIVGAGILVTRGGRLEEPPALGTRVVESPTRAATTADGPVISAGAFPSAPPSATASASPGPAAPAAVKMLAAKPASERVPYELDRVMPPSVQPRSTASTTAPSASAATSAVAILSASNVAPRVAPTRGDVKRDVGPGRSPTPAATDNVKSGL